MFDDAADIHIFAIYKCRCKLIQSIVFRYDSLDFGAKDF